jgi:predicted transcriptional regulator of viral defense system
LGVDIPLGRIKQTILDRERFVSAVHAALVEANSTGKAVRVELRELRVKEQYLDWKPEMAIWDALYEGLVRLSANAGPYDGYFTRVDARAAGMSDTVFEAALRDGKLESISVDIYHLVQFPRSDREQHVILWLQTDREGVLSHETALLLHELSDILPQRLHITVPPGFDPGSRQFDPTVELLRGDVADDEKCWLGPVPYTSALRTLRDCIAIGVSPDLIEQAIEQGLERGLFTRAQIPVILPAKSA